VAFVVFSCRGCGSGISVQPDNLLTVCTHCGTLYPSRELGDVPVHIVPSAPEDKIRAAVVARMRADKQMRGVRIHIDSASGTYVPLFVQRVSATGRWAGYRNEKRGKSTVRVDLDGDIRHDGDFPVFARQHAHEFGIAALGQILYALAPIPFRDVEWSSAAMPVLSVDIDEHHADMIVEDSLGDLLGERIKAAKQLDAFTAFTMDTVASNRFILLVPLWTVTYTWRGGSYRVAVSGAGKQPVVLAAMEPVFLARRLWHLALGLAGVLGAGALGYLSWIILLAGDSDDAGKLAAAIGAGILACIWLAWRTGGKLVSSVNVEQIGRTGEVLS